MSDRDKLIDYFERYKDLITSLSDSSFRDVVYSIERYNEMMLKGKISTKVTDTLTITDEVKDNRDIILNLLISNFRIVTNWIEFYGIDLHSCLKLDFSSYHTMLKSLQEHNELVQKASEAARQKIQDEAGLNKQRGKI